MIDYILEKNFLKFKKKKLLPYSLSVYLKLLLKNKNNLETVNKLNIENKDFKEFSNLLLNYNFFVYDYTQDYLSKVYKTKERIGEIKNYINMIFKTNIFDSKNYIKNEETIKDSIEYFVNRNIVKHSFLYSYIAYLKEHMYFFFKTYVNAPKDFTLQERMLTFKGFSEEVKNIKRIYGYYKKFLNEINYEENQTLIDEAYPYLKYFVLLKKEDEEEFFNSKENNSLFTGFNDEPVNEDSYVGVIEADDNNLFNENINSNSEELNYALARVAYILTDTSYDGLVIRGDYYIENFWFIIIQQSYLNYLSRDNNKFYELFYMPTFYNLYYDYLFSRIDINLFNIEFLDILENIADNRSQFKKVYLNLLKHLINFLKNSERLKNIISKIKETKKIEYKELELLLEDFYMHLYNSIINYLEKLLKSPEGIFNVEETNILLLSLQYIITDAGFLYIDLLDELVYLFYIEKYRNKEIIKYYLLFMKLYYLYIRGFKEKLIKIFGEENYNKVKKEFEKSKKYGTEILKRYKIRVKNNSKKSYITLKKFLETEEYISTHVKNTNFAVTFLTLMSSLFYNLKKEETLDIKKYSEYLTYYLMISTTEISLYTIETYFQEFDSDIKKSLSNIEILQD